MNIQLKQSEIIDALKQYIVKQGINLSGKEVAITFTAGRKEAGITADLVIEDGVIPGFSEVEEETQTEITKPSSLKVVDNSPDLEVAAEEQTEIQEPDPETEVPVAKTTSLFS